MIFGGNWTTQNKKPPGAYIRFTSNSNGTFSDDSKKSSSVLGVGKLGNMKLSA